MRLAILADIHGNLPALEAVVADVQHQSVNGIIVAGDFSDGPQASEVIQLLRSLDSRMIRGNREDYFLAYHTGNAPDPWRVSDQWAGFRWMARRLDRETMEFVASLPVHSSVTLAGTAPIRVVHGSPRGTSDLLLPDHDPSTLDLFSQAGLLSLGYPQIRLAEALAQISESVLVCGHSHIPWKGDQDSRLAVNPGSVGAPINGDVRAQYALLTWQAGRWHAQHRAIAYDLGRTRAAYHESGLLAEGGALIRAFMLCTQTGQNVPGRLVLHFRQVAAKAGFTDGRAIPDAIWEQAAATFDWEAAAS